MDLLNEFKKFLFSQANPPSKVTVKNYLSDVNNFVKWFVLTSKENFSPEAITKTTIDNYKTEMEKTLSPVSLQRHLSSLRKFFFFLVLENKISKDPFKPLATPKDENDPWKLKDFKNYLYVYNASHLTIKNYIIDVKQFLNWAEEVTGLQAHAGASVFEAINSELLEEYKKRLVQNGQFSASTVNRKLSSLRKYIAWGLEENLISPFELGIGNFQQEKLTPKFIEEKEFSQLPKVEIPIAAIQYSKFPPLRLFQKVTKGIDLFVEANLISNIAKAIETSSHLAWKVKGQPIFDKARKIRLPRYIDKIDIFGVRNIKKEFYAPLELSMANLPRYKQLWLKIRYQRPKWYKTYHSYAFAHYLNFVVLIIFVAGLTLGFYNGFVKATHPTLAANPNLPTNPLRILSFQGRLTDNSSNPITTPTNLRFAIYRDAAGTGAAVLLWQEVDQVSPDQDGIFNTLLGNTSSVCASPTGTILGKCAIYSSLFSENNALWLGVTVESTGELTPRQPIATVAYAVNSETLQGLPPITATASGVTNVVLALDSTGNLTIGSGATSASPIFSVNGNLTLSSNTLKVLGTLGTAPVSSISGKTSIASLIVNNDGVGDIFTASASGWARFTITNTGAIGLGPNGTNIGTSAQCLIGGSIPSWGTCGSGGGTNWWNQVGGLVYPTNTGWDVAFGGSATASALFTFLHTNASFSNQPSLTVWNSTSQTNGLTLTASSTDATIDATTGTINIGHGGGTLFIQTDIQNDSANNSGAIQITDRLNVLPAATSNNVNASLIVNNPGTGDIFTASQGGTQKFTVTNSGGIRLGTSEGTNLNCLLSGGTGVAASWGTCDPNGFGWWNQVNGVVYPTSSLYDFAVGGTSTASATFSVTGNQLSFPIASVAGRLTVADNLKRLSPTPIATISGNTGSVILSLNNNGFGDLLTASNGGNTKFTVDRNGFIGLGGSQIIPGNTNYITAPNFSVTNAGVITAATSNTINSLSINGGALSGVTGYSQSSGTFTLNGSGTVSVGTGTNAVTVGNTGGGLTLPSTSITLSAFGGGAGNSNAVLYANSSNALAQAVTTNTGNCLLSNGSGGNPSWGTCTGINWWDQVGGVVYPDNTGWDFAVGGTSTASATFSVTGDMFTFPIGSMAGRFTIADNLKRLSPTPIATISGNTGSVVLSINNNGRGDLLTASTGGNTKFTVDTNGFLGLGGRRIVPGNTADITLQNGDTIANTAAGTTALSSTTFNLGGGSAATITTTTNGLTLDSGSNTLTFAASDTTLTTSLQTFNANATLGISSTTLNLGNGSAATLATTSNQNLTLSAGSGTLNLNTSSNTGAVSIGNATGAITLNGNTTVATAKTLTLTDINGNNQVLYGAATTGVVSGTTATSTQGLCLLSGLNTAAPSWQSCPASGGTNWWNQVGGVVYPTTSGWDFAVGGTSTASATFAVINNITSFPTATTTALLNVANDLRRVSPVPIATISGNTGSVVLSLNNNGRGDLLTASTGGNTKFTLDTNGFIALGGRRIIPGNTSDITLQNGDTIANSAANTTALSSTTFNLGNGSAATLATTSNQNLTLSAGSGTLNLNTSSNTGAVSIGNGTGQVTIGGNINLTLSNATFATCGVLSTVANVVTCSSLPAGSTNWWNQVNGVVYPTSSLYDFAVGGTSTASATFSVTGNQLSFPIASMAGRLTVADNLKRLSPTPIATISGNTGSVVLSLNNNGRGDLLTASTGGNTKFTVDTNGFIALGGRQIIPGNTSDITFRNGDTIANGAAGTLTVTPGSGTTETLTVATATTLSLFNTQATTLNFAGAATTMTMGGSGGTLTLGNGGAFTITGASGQNITLTTAGAGTLNLNTSGTGPISIGNGSGTITLTLGSDARGDLYTRNVSGNLARIAIGGNGTCLTSNGTDPSWGSCGTGVNWWNQVNGVVYPTSSLYDFAVGGTSTASATFSVTGNQLTFPIASVAGRLTVADNLKRVSPTPIATISGNTGSVVLSLNNNGRGDLLTASTGGNTKFTLDTNGFIALGGRQIIPGNTSDITLRNGETIDNATDNTLNIGYGAANGIFQITSATSGNLTFSSAGNINSTGTLTLQPTGNIALAPSGTNDVTYNPIAGQQLLITQTTSAPTTDMVSITNAGLGTTTSGVSNLQLTFVGGSAAVESSGERIDLTPGGTSGGTWNALRLVAATGGPASGVIQNLIKIEGPTTNTGTTNGIIIGATNSQLFTTAINIASTGVTTDLSLQNGETLDNNTDNQFNLGFGAAAGTLLLTSTTNSVINASTRLDLQADGSVDVNIAGGSGATGCTVTNTTGALNCSGAISSNGISLSNWWSQVGGLVYPINTGWDFAIGGTSTASAEFGFFGTAPFNTFPFATIAGRLNVADNLKRLSPTPIATISGNTGSVVLSLNNNGRGDLLTASSSGAPQFTVTNGGSVYARSFFDYDNSSYFLDPAATNTSLTTAGAVAIGGTNVSRGILNVYQAADTSSGGIGIINSAVTNSLRIWEDSNNIGRIDGGATGDLDLSLNGSGVGDVGIGTTTALGKLHIQNDLTLSTNYSSTMYNIATIAGTFTFNNSWKTSNPINGLTQDIRLVGTATNSGVVRGLDINLTNEVANTTTGSIIGGDFDVENRFNASLSASLKGVNTFVYHDSNGRVSNMFGGDFFVEAEHSSCKTCYVNQMIGVLGDVEAFSGGSIGSAMGLYSYVDTSAATNAYGLYIDFVGGVNDWALYSNANAPSYFNGDVGIDTTAPGAKLDVADNGAAAGTALINVGDDSFLTDVDLANTLGIRGSTTSTTAILQLGSANGRVWTDTSGNVLIGGAGDTAGGAVFDNGNPKVKLNIFASTYNRMICKSAAGGGLLGIGICNNAFSTNDVAERVIAPSTQPGDILVVDPNSASQSNKNIADRATYAARAQKPYDKSAIGVYSSDGFEFSEKNLGPQSVPMAIAGVVPIRVSSINGPIKKGTPITTSIVPGIGMAATRAGPIVARSEENWDTSYATQAARLVNNAWTVTNGNCSNGESNCYPVETIVSLLNISSYDPDTEIATTSNYNIQDQNASDSGFTFIHNFNLSDPNGNPIQRMTALSEAVIAKLRAGLITAAQISTNALSVTTDKITIAGQSIHDYIASVVNEVLNGQNYVSPLNTNGGIAIYDQISTSSAVATIDTHGNASFSGSLNVGNDATIGGTLRAKKIIADQIEGLNINASTVSANYITNVTNIYSTDPFPTLPASPSSVDNSNIFAGVLANNKFVNIATLSSQLAYVENLDAVNASIANGLNVYGPSALSDTSIVGQLSINGTFILNNNSINVLGADLNLQPLRQGGLSIMAGLISVDTNGNMTLENNLTVKGTLFANNISPSSGDEVNIGSPSSLLTVKSTGDVIASGAGTFNKLNIGSLVGTALAVSPTEVIATGSAGTASIAAGRAEITIDNKLVTDKSLIYITPTTQTYQPLFLLRQVPNTSFTVGIETSDISPIKFNWIIIN